MITHNYSGQIKQNIIEIIKECINKGITNQFTQVAILCVAGEESGFIPHDENLNYSKERLPEVWKIFSKTGVRVKKGQGKYNYNDLAVKCEHNPEALGDLVYKSGGGYKYRGRGYGQLTFNYNYKKQGDMIGVDLLNNPDLANNPDVAAKLLVNFIVSGKKKANLNGFTDQLSALKAVSSINAGGINNVDLYDFFKKQVLISKNFKII